MKGAVRSAGSTLKRLSPTEVQQSVAEVVEHLGEIRGFQVIIIINGG